MTDMLNCVARMYDCRDKIAAFPVGRAKIDLQKMYNYVTIAHRNANKLWVPCNRTQKISAEYAHAVQLFEESIINLEQYLLLAHLMKDH